MTTRTPMANCEGLSLTIKKQSAKIKYLGVFMTTRTLCQCSQRLYTRTHILCKYLWVHENFRKNVFLFIWDPGRVLWTKKCKKSSETVMSTVNVHIHYPGSVSCPDSKSWDFLPSFLHNSNPSAPLIHVLICVYVFANGLISLRYLHVQKLRGVRAIFCHDFW